MLYCYIILLLLLLMYGIIDIGIIMIKAGELLCWILTKSLNFIEEIKKRMSSKNMILQLTIHGWSI